MVKMRVDAVACMILTRQIDDLTNNQEQEDNDYIVELYKLLQDATASRLSLENQLF